MPALVRLTDTNDAQGAVISNTARTVIANGLTVAYQGSIVAPHKPFIGPHNSAKIMQGCATVIVEGHPAAFVGAADSCGHSQIKGSPDVQVPGA